MPIDMRTNSAYIKVQCRARARAICTAAATVTATTRARTQGSANNGVDCIKASLLGIPEMW